MKADGSRSDGDDEPADILQQLAVWDQAGIPRPARKLVINYAGLPAELSTGRVNLPSQHLAMLDELLPWCIMRRDYPSAVAICQMLWRSQDIFVLFKRSWLRETRRKEHSRFQTIKRSIFRMLEGTAELTLASGLASEPPMRTMLQHLALLQLTVRQTEIMGAEVALQQLEAGKFSQASVALSMTLTKAAFGLTAEAAPRWALRALVAYYSWTQSYLESRRQTQVAEAQQNAEYAKRAVAAPAATATVTEAKRQATGGGGAGPSTVAAAAPRAGPHAHELQPQPQQQLLTRAWEHVPVAWSAAKADPQFRDSWRDCERLLRESIRHLRGSTTKLSYYLAKTYCAAGRVSSAVTTGALAVRAAPGEPDAVALALLTTQLQGAVRRRLGDLEWAAGLSAGAAAQLLGLRLAGRGPRGAVKNDADAEDAEGAGGGLGEEPHMAESEGGEEEAKPKEEEEGVGRAGGAAAEAAAAEAEAEAAPRSTVAALLAAAAAGRSRGMKADPAAAAAAAAAAAGPGPVIEAAPSAAPPPQRRASEPSAEKRRKSTGAAGAATPAAAATVAVDALGGGSIAAVHSAVEMQLAALQSDPLCAPALAGLARVSSHCSACTLALVRGCLLHLDCCTTGMLYSPYEAEAWALLDSSLAGLAAAAAALPQVDAADQAGGAGGSAASAGPTPAAGAPRGAGRRKRRRGDDGDDADTTALRLWQQKVEPELRDRATWWPSTAFSEPPTLLRHGGDGGGAAAVADVCVLDGALLQHLQHRARVAALMLGPFNYYTRHVLHEMQLLRQCLCEERLQLRRQRQRRRCRMVPVMGSAKESAHAGDDVDADGAGDEDDVMDLGGDGADKTTRTADTAAAAAAAADTLAERRISILAAGEAAVAASAAAVMEGVVCARALVRRLAPPAPPAPRPAPPMPPALLACVPRALQRRNTGASGAAAS